MEKRKTLNEFLTGIFEEVNSDIKKNTNTEKKSIIDSIKSGSYENFNKFDDSKITVLDNKWIKDFKDELLKLEEFRYTKEINVIPLPTYHCNEEDKSLAPIAELDSSTKLLHTDVSDKKVVTTMSYLIKEDTEIHYFPEVVNLYSIAISPKVYDPEKIKEETSKLGLHVMPQTYEISNFTPKREFRFSWNPEEMQDLEAMGGTTSFEEWKESIFKLIEEKALDNYNISIPHVNNFMLRGTNLERLSIKKIER